MFLIARQLRARRRDQQRDRRYLEVELLVLAPVAVEAMVLFVSGDRK
jgi:hypothetical protein